ncbi:MAG: alpha-galactosidase, partial [Myxococcota bacterium]|nr:alpha-galactosidase [Myxococcota bacterium]
MSVAPPVARHPRAGRLEAVRVGVRFAAIGPDGSVGTEAFAEGPLLPGSQAVGPFRLRVGLGAGDDTARVDVAVANEGELPVQIEAVVVGVRWPGVGGDVRFLRHGWQSWSFCGGRPLDDAGEPPFPSGPWLRGLHHAVGAPPDDRAGWHESDLVTVAVADDGRACLAGVLERADGTGLVYLRRERDAVRVEVEVRHEVPLDPGRRLELEPVHLALGDDEHALLEAYGDALGREGGARTAAAFQTGWCSWYQFFHDVTEEALLRNLEALAAARPRIPVSVVQLDDGYQRAIGDWLLTNPKFPRGLAPVAEAIREAGFRPGLWTAPFCVAPDARLFEARPEWLLRSDAMPDEPHVGLLHPEWSKDPRIFVLDTSRDDVCEHLVRTFAALAGMGFVYQKLDFLYAVAMRARAADPRVPRARRLRRGLDAVRRGAGEEAFLLGCGCPLGAAVGAVDGMRIGPDVAPTWVPDPASAIPGIEATQPSTRSAVRSILARAWMHRRLWLNDPDCLMARTRGTKLTPDEVDSLAAAIAVTGGMVVFSDDVPALAEDDVARVAGTARLAREVDAAGRAGVARPRRLVAGEIAEGAVAALPGGALHHTFHPGPAPREVELDLAAEVPDAGELPPVPELGGPEPQGRDPRRPRAELAPHASWLLRVTGRPRLAVFCDYDGTFARQDVGSTIAQRWAGARRPALWERLRRGELTPWTYNMELLDGLALPEERLDAFLRTVEPDPGAHALVAWCEERGVPFRVLSDGFDRNLDRLQELHGVRFHYDANHLWYEHGRWRLAPGH